MNGWIRPTPELMGRGGVARSAQRTNSRTWPTSRRANTVRGAVYLRREGLYSSLISEWRKQRDAGVLAGKRPGEKVGRLTAEQAEIARLTRENARMSKRLATTEAALDIMGKAHALLESLSERADFDEQRKNR